MYHPLGRVKPSNFDLLHFTLFQWQEESPWKINIPYVVEKIHSVGTINNVETSYFTQLKICYLITAFRCPLDILITSCLFTARWSTWPGNHLVPCVAELVGSCIPIHARRCLPDPECLFYPSGLSLCLSVDHFCLVPVDNMVLFHGMVYDGWLVSYTALPSQVTCSIEL